MQRRINIGKIRRTRIYIHWTFLLLLVWITWILIEHYRLHRENTELIVALSPVFSLILSIAILETGHTSMIKSFGYTPNEIVIFPIGSVAGLNEIPRHSYHETLISLAGPFLNLTTALILYPLIQWFSNIPYLFTSLFKTGELFLFELMVANGLLAVVNLIPIFPTAAGKILKNTISKKSEPVKTVSIITITGQVITLLFFFIVLFIHPFAAFAGIFIIIMIQVEGNHYSAVHSILFDYKVRNVMAQKFFTLDALNTINDTIKELLDVQATDFLVTYDGSVIGTVNRNGILKALAEKGGNAAVTSIMNKKISFLTPEMPISWAYNLLNSGKNFILPVVENNKLSGIVDMDNIKEFIMTRTAGRIPLYV